MNEPPKPGLLREAQPPGLHVSPGQCGPDRMAGLAGRQPGLARDAWSAGPGEDRTI